MAGQTTFRAAAGQRYKVLLLPKIRITSANLFATWWKVLHVAEPLSVATFLMYTAYTREETCSRCKGRKKNIRPLYKNRGSKSTRFARHFSYLIVARTIQIHIQRTDTSARSALSSQGIDKIIEVHYVFYLEKEGHLGIIWTFSHKLYTFVKLCW